MRKLGKRAIGGLFAAVFASGFIFGSSGVTANAAATESMDYEIDLSTLSYESGESTGNLTVYTADDYDAFLTDYTNGTLPDIYVTEFLFNGIGQAQKISVDDDTNEVTIKDISTTVINVNTTGNIEFSGTAEDTMIAVNTNDVTGAIDLYLDGVNLTSSKNTSAIIVYNKDVTYGDCKVTIRTVSGTQNYISGGKLKKASTMLTANLSEYTAKSSVYADTTNSYYYYFENEQNVSDLSNLLFAQETADSEKIAEGDPYTYYKYSGAIGSDIDLYFEGDGYLEVSSQGDEGIETKGDLVFSGGTGDYKISAYDDGLNASTNGTDISINVNSMLVNVLDSGDDDSEGDGIDSNGTIHIYGGTIYAFSHPTSQDDGIDSDQGTYINGGTVIATGNMADEVSNESTQEFIKLVFQTQQEAGTTVCLTDADGNPVMAFTSDRTFTNLLYSSPDLTQTTYSVYKGGTVEGTSTNGLYDTITGYTAGTQQQWSAGDMQGNPGGNGETPNGEMDGQTPPDLPDGETPGQAPSDQGNSDSQNQMPSDQTNSDSQSQAPSDQTNSDSQSQTPSDQTNSDSQNQTPPDLPDGETSGQQSPDSQNNDTANQTAPDSQNGNDGNTTPGANADNTTGTTTGSIEFTLSDSMHTFHNVTDYVVTADESDGSDASQPEEDDSKNNEETSNGAEDNSDSANSDSNTGTDDTSDTDNTNDTNGSTDTNGTTDTGSTSTTSSSGNTAANTGDSNHLLLLCVIIAASTGVIVATRKHKKSVR